MSLSIPVRSRHVWSIRLTFGMEQQAAYFEGKQALRKACGMINIDQYAEPRRFDNGAVTQLFTIIVTAEGDLTHTQRSNREF